MPETAARAQPPRRHPVAAGRAFLTVVRRVYALVLIAIIVWLTFLAVRYLVRSLIKSPPPPPQITELPIRLTENVLRTPLAAWPAVGAAEHARAPLAHYHRIDGWIEPDRFNDCTRSGCHEPLPHSKRKEVRAFLNMHATSIHCGVCHVQSADQPLKLTWYDLQGGRSRPAPALFDAYAFAGRQWLVPPGAAEQAELVKLLRAAARESGYVPEVQRLAEHAAAVRAGSPAFQDVLDAVRATLPQQFRGEYGAKLAQQNPQTGQPVLGHAGTEGAVRDYLKRGATLSGAERDALLAKVHPQKRAQPLHCTDCHRQTGSLIDFAALGYPPARREALFRPLIFQMIEHIAAGQPMYLPQFVTPGEPASQPSRAPQPGATRPGM